MIAPARTAALAALRSIESGRIDLATALAQARERLRDDRDRALAADIITGTLRWRGTLDHLVAHMAGRAIGRIDADVLDILRLSVYQILHLTRVPVSAVVDDAVDLARMAKRQSATGFVNAVLRTAVRQRRRLPLPERPDDPTDHAAALAYLSVTQSHPAWLVERWLERYGFAATEQWVQFNNAVPAMSLRANRLRARRDEVASRLQEEDIQTTPTRWAPDGLVVTAGHALRSQHRGLFTVQDEASQIVAEVLAAGPGQSVLDMCASPGGKTTALVGAMHDEGVLVACDVRPRRMRLLRDAVDRSGATSVRLVQIPRSGPLPFTASFTSVLVDAPCSGLGTLRRDPDIKWRRTVADLAPLADAQLDLLLRAADVVRPGGRLVYATCSSEPEENEYVVRAFLSVRPEFASLDLRGVLPSPMDTLVDAYGHLRTLPFSHGLEAFFAAALTRQTLP